MGYVYFVFIEVLIVDCYIVGLVVKRKKGDIYGIFIFKYLKR